MKKIKNGNESVIGKWLRISIIFFAVAYSLNGFLISPLLISLSGDIMYDGTVIPILLKYARELVELVAIAVSYSVMICILYSFGRNRIKPIFVIFCVATAYKYLVNTAVSWIMSGSVPTLWIWDIVNVLYYTLLEFVQIVIIYLIIRPGIERFCEKISVAKKAVTRLGEDCGVIVPRVYPFEKIYDRENGLCRSALICAVVSFVAKLTGNVISDLWAIFIFGPPTESVTWILMAVNYVSKSIFALMVYFVIYATIPAMLKLTKT